MDQLQKRGAAESGREPDQERHADMAAHHPQQRGEHGGSQADAGVEDDVEDGIVACAPAASSQMPTMHISDQQDRHGVDDRRLLALDALIGG